VVFVISGVLMMLNLLKSVKIYKKLKDLDPMVAFGNTVKEA